MKTKKKNDINYWKKTLTPEIVTIYNNKEIAEMFNISYHYVSYLKKKLNLTKKYRTIKEWKKIFKKYSLLKYTSKEIAEKIDCDPKTVRLARTKCKIKKDDLYKEYFTEKRLRTMTLKEMGKELNMRDLGVSKAIHRVLGLNAKPRVRKKHKL